ncbi:RagB/SusD family nutrient uptake outer membrane protein [Mariniflexile sp.]|uniref:RagB/SusD family nutrient uptake outer membrane protein n=1 Tax=Mariniflexile sp. TaxID=1979402 RepID=UPI0040471699
MKKILLAICIVFTVTNCNNDYLETASLTQIAEGNFWQSEADAFLALNGVYSALQNSSMYGGSLNAWQGIPGYDCLGDNAYNQYEWEGPGIFMEGNYSPINGQFAGIWNDSYRGIARINGVIKNVQDISESLIPLETKDALLGQAYFLRALIYFNLAVYFEDAPLITAPQTLENAYVAKNTYAEITEQIRKDLTFAIEALPPSHPPNLYGYATKGAALGLFARVQLYNKVYNDPQNGVLVLTQKALNLGYTLHSNYGNLFTPANETSPEIVFSVRFLANPASNNGETFSGTYGGSPKVDQRPMPNLVNDYYCTDGLPITSSPLYNPSNKKQNRDPRALATIYFAGDQFLDSPVTTFPGNGPTGFGMRKYIKRGPDADGNGIAGQGSQDFYVIRYADILLMRAEAMAETGDVSGARTLVNQVRNRVNMPSVESVEGAVNQQQMIQIVRHERRVELALEGLRFMDLKRWGTIEEAFNRAISDPVGPYNPQYRQGKSEVFPIPQDELDVNTSLKQNPVWL